MADTILENKLLFDHFYSQPGLYYGDHVRSEFHDLIKSIDCSDYSVLDLGCGEGRYSLYLSPYVQQIISIDYSNEGISKLNEIANKNHLNITPICEDVNNTTFENEKYDLIVMATLLDHLNAAEQKVLIEKLFFSLNNNGLIYAEVFTTKDPGYKKKANASKVLSKTSETSSAIRHYFKPGELKNLFSMFEILEYSEFVEEDRIHGPVHDHGWAYIIAKRTSLTHRFSTTDK